jgi:hypothetical protein
MGTMSVPTKESVMMKTVLTLCVIPFLTMPAFAGSLVVVDKPMVVAQGADIQFGGAGIEVGERDRYRDHDWRRHHRDQDWRRYHRDRGEVVVERRRHRDWDRPVYR